MNKVYDWISHVLLTTTVNVASSETSFDESFTSTFEIPTSFFYNKEAFDVLFGDSIEV